MVEKKLGSKTVALTLWSPDWTMTSDWHGRTSENPTQSLIHNIIQAHTDFGRDIIYYIRDVYILRLLLRLRLRAQGDSVENTGLIWADTGISTHSKVKADIQRWNVKFKRGKTHSGGAAVCFASGRPEHYKARDKSQATRVGTLNCLHKSLDQHSAFVYCCLFKSVCAERVRGR